MNTQERLKAKVRDVVDFPKKGIVFKDITPVLTDASLCSDIVATLADKYYFDKLDAIAGVESRGFFFGFYWQINWVFRLYRLENQVSSHSKP